MPRQKAKIRQEYIEIWHIEDYEPGSRYYKLIQALAEEDEFNDPYACVAVTDDSTTFSTEIGAGC